MTTLGNALLALGALAQEASEEATSLETRTALRWLDAPPAWVIGLVIVPALLGLIWWTYRREPQLTPRQRAFLCAFRVLGIAVILLAAFRPAFEVTRNLKVRTEVHFLVDDSASMGRHESYEQERASAIQSALADAPPGASTPKELETMNRIELTSLVLGGGGEGASARARGPGRRLLEGLEKDFDLRWFRFWDRSYPIGALDELEGKAPATRIGDSLDLHLAHHGVDSSSLEAIVLVTDGRNNEGLEPTESASRLTAAEVPLYVIGVGDPGHEQNLTLSGPPGPQQVLQNEEAVFELSVTAKGLPQTEFAAVLRAQLRTSDGAGDTDAGVQKDHAQVPMPGPGETRKFQLRTTFSEPGDYILTFEVPLLAGETNPKDNITRRYLRVDSDKVRVLYLEEGPRWEYRFLKNALKRVDKSVQVQCYLFDASKSFLQEASEELPPLTALPATRADLFKYHVILLGDIPPWRLGATEEQRAEWLTLLKEFVEHGGGVGFLAGTLAMPEAYRETALEDLLPVVIGDLTDEDAPASIGDVFVPALENPHAPHPIVRLHDDLDINRALWAEGLAGMSWYYPVLRAKAGASVLLRHPHDENKYGRRVIAALAPYPKGRVFFSAIDETWRWRKYYEEKYQDRYWRNVVRTLAENKLRRSDDRVALTVDREEVDVGDRVRVYLHLLDEDYNPVQGQDSARLFLRLPSGKLTSIVAPRLQGEPGRFEAVVPLTDEGVYSVLYYKEASGGTTQPDGRPLARQDVIARVPRKELAETSLDEPAMIALAQAANGRYARLASADALLEGFKGFRPGIKTVDRRLREIWDQAWTVLLAVLLLAVEWVLRKRWRMV